MKRAPAYDKAGLPLCSEELCPEYDGKRCREMGFRPDQFCEPQLRNDYANVARLRRAKLANSPERKLAELRADVAAKGLEAERARGEANAMAQKLLECLDRIAAVRKFCADLIEDLRDDDMSFHGAGQRAVAKRVLAELDK